MKKFIVKNNATGREFIVEGSDDTSLEIVWMSVRPWFLLGCDVTITTEDGISKTFYKWIV